MYWMPSWPIFSRTILTRSARPGALTWASKSVIAVPFGIFLGPATRAACLRRPVRAFVEVAKLSAPRKRAVRSRMQSTLGEAREAKRLEQLTRSPADVLRRERADADHLVAVVGVGDHVDVVAEAVEDREVVGGEGADAPGGLTFEVRKRSLEALLAESERGAPHAREILAHHEVRRLRSIRVDVDRGGIRLDFEGHGAALHAAEVEIGLVVDAPEPVGDHRAVDVGVERRIRVDVDHRRHLP